MELTPEQINSFISNAVLESQIGVAVQESVKRVVAELNKSYQNPFDQVIRNHVSDIIDEQLRTTYKDSLTEGIK